MERLKKIISTLLSLMLLLGMVAIPSPAYAEGDEEFVEADYKIENIDGESYKVYKFTDLFGTLESNEQLEADSLEVSEPRILHPVGSPNPALGDEIPDASRSVDVQWTTYDLQPGDLGTPVYFQIFDSVSFKTIAQTDNVTGTGNYTFKKLPAWNDSDVSHAPVDWTVRAPNEYRFDVRLRTGTFGRPVEENIKAIINQRGVPIYRAEYYTNKTAPTIEAQRTNKNDNTITVPINDKNLGENQYYSWAEAISAQRKPFFEGKELDIQKYGADTLMSLQVSDDITAGRVKMAMKAPGKTDFDRGPSTFEDNGTPYHYEVTGDYLHLHIFTIRQDLTVKFNPNGGKWTGTAPADQTIGHSMKLGDSWAGLGPINVPGAGDLTPPTVAAGEPEKEFIGWNTDANATTALFTDNKYAQPITADVTTFYAIYKEKAQGKVTLEYVDASGTAIVDKYKITGQSYPTEKGGNIGETVGTDVASTAAAPKFLGYEVTGVGVTPAAGQTTATYTDPATATVTYKYKKLADIIPDKTDNGTDNQDATPDVKATYKKVTIKVDSNKGKFQKGNADVTKSEFLYYVNPVEGKTLQNVLDESGLTPKSNDENANKIDTAKPWLFTPDKTKADTPADVALTTKVTKENFKDADVVMEVNFGQTKADQLKDKLDPVDIRVWVDDTDTDGSKITWKNGVKLKEANKDDQTLKGLLAGATVTDLGENGTLAQEGTKRNSSKQNLPDGKKGNLKVAFDDGSALVVENQTLYVAPLKVPVKPGEQNQIDPEKLPTDKVAVEFKLGEGVKIGTKEGNATTPVLYETYYVKPNTSLEAGDIPETTLQEGYKNNKWYKGEGANATAAQDSDYENITAAKTFVAKAEQTDAKKYGDKLKAKDIVKWVGDQIDWTKGVEEIPNVTFKSVEDQGNRSTASAGVFLGKLKVTFNDDSTAEVEKQKLIVREKKADKKKPEGDDPGTYPADAIDITFAKSTGIASLNPENKVIAMKSGESLVADDYPAVTVKPNFKEKTNKTDYYDTQPGVMTASKTITASTTEIGQGSAKVEYHVGAENITDKIADLKIDGQTYPANNKLTGTEDTAIDTTKITQPELLGYKIVNITTDPATDARYTQAGTAKVIFNYEKIDDIVGPVQPGDTKPAGYVEVVFKSGTHGKFAPDADVKYFVNPKTVTINTAEQKLSGKDKEDKELNKDFPVVSSVAEGFVANKQKDGKYHKDGTQQWALSGNTLTENKLTDTNKGITLTADYRKKFNVEYVIEVEPKGKELPKELKDLTADYNDKKADKTGLEPGTVYTKPTNLDLTKVSDEAKKLIGKEVGKWWTTGEWKESGNEESGKIIFKLTWILNEKKPYNPGYFYEPSPDYLNTGAPAKKEEKVQEKYLEAYRWYVKGNDMGMFMPKKGITRAEVAQMFARALEYDKAMVNVNITPYTDVDANAWYYEAVQKTSAAGIFKGSDKGTFMPTREITKAELIATIARFQHLSTKAGNTLNLQANHWATAEVEAAYQEGWLDIYTNGTAQFAADEVISREEVVTILNRAFGRIADTKYIDDNAHTMTNFPDATKDMWSYYEIMTAANTYLVDKMWVNHATKDNGPETLKEMIEWVKPLLDNKDVREVVEQVRFQR